MRWLEIRRLVVVTTALWLASASPAAAQIGGGSIAGSVVDQAGARVPGATVTITAAVTNLSRTVVTGEQGTYLFSGLAPGVYRILVESSGFRPLIRDGLPLATGDTVRVDLRLEVGAVTEALTVTADEPLLRGHASGLGHVVDNRNVIHLPLNGRSFVTLAALVPGVAVPPAPAAPFRESTVGGPAPTSTSSTAFQCFSPSRAPSSRRRRSRLAPARAILCAGPVIAISIWP